MPFLSITCSPARYPYAGSRRAARTGPSDSGCPCIILRLDEEIIGHRFADNSHRDWLCRDCPFDSARCGAASSQKPSRDCTDGTTCYGTSSECPSDPRLGAVQQHLSTSTERGVDCGRQRIFPTSGVRPGGIQGVRKKELAGETVCARRKYHHRAIGEKPVSIDVQESPAQSP